MSGMSCHMHGHAGLAHVCPHIKNAIDTRSQMPNWLSYPLAKPLHDYVVLRVCSACVEVGQLPMPARMLRDGELDPEHLGTAPMCEACFAARASSP